MFSKCFRSNMECAENPGPSKTEAEIKGPLGIKYDDSEDILTVVLAVPGIKRPWFGFWGKNTEVDIKFEEQSLRVHLEITKKSKLKQDKTKSPDKCLYIVRQLPAKISVDDCYHRLKENQCIIYLRKESPASWQNQLDSNGLDQFEETS